MVAQGDRTGGAGHRLGDRMRGEHDLQVGHRHPGRRRVPHGCDRALDERRPEPGQVEVRPHLVDPHRPDGDRLTAAPSRSPRGTAGRTSTTSTPRWPRRATGPGRRRARPGPRRRYTAPSSGCPRARARVQFGLQGGLQCPALLVDRRPATQRLIVVRDLDQPLVGDAPTAGDVAQERHHVVGPLGSAEPGQQHRVVPGDRRVGGDGAGRRRRRHRRTSTTPASSTRRPLKKGTSSRTCILAPDARRCRIRSTVSCNSSASRASSHS